MTKHRVASLKQWQFELLLEKAAEISTIYAISYEDAYITINRAFIDFNVERNSWIRRLKKCLNQYRKN